VCSKNERFANANRFADGINPADGRGDVSALRGEKEIVATVLDLPA
jgi:hypothetical protein